MIWLLFVFSSILYFDLNTLCCDVTHDSTYSTWIGLHSCQSSDASVGDPEDPTRVSSCWKKKWKQKQIFHLFFFPALLFRKHSHEKEIYKKSNSCVNSLTQRQIPNQKIEIRFYIIFLQSSILSSLLIILVCCIFRIDLSHLFRKPFHLHRKRKKRPD
jgi:hypothetical protein